MVSDLLQRGNVKEVIFIDTGIDGWQTLVDGVPEGADIVTLDPSRDGLEQMAQWAQTHSGYDAIHIISHGSEGQIHLAILASMRVLSILVPLILPNWVPL